MAEFALTIIGCGSALPMHGRHPSAQVLQYDEQIFLIDCGESTQMRLRSAGIRPFRIKLILISHLHGDHFFGLPGLLSSFSHLHRTEELIIFGPVGIKALLEEIKKYTELKISYPLNIIELAPNGITKIWSSGNLEILTFPLDHRIMCNGYLFREISPVVKLKKEKIEKLHLTIEQIHALQRGEDISYEGKILKNAELTFGQDQLMSYAYCSDTRYNEKLIQWIKFTSVLYHETTFRNDMRLLAEQTGHSTAGDAGRIAQEAQVFCLITGHYSSRYKDVKEIVAEAGVHFPNVLESVEGKKYNLRLLSARS
jgi:ribonuclease Z